MSDGPVPLSKAEVAAMEEERERRMAERMAEQEARHAERLKEILTA